MVGRGAVNGTENGRHMSYFFHGGKYAKIFWEPDRNDNRLILVRELAKSWKSIQQVGFASVDAILPIPDATNRAYFFSKSSYALIHFIPGNPNNKLLGKGSIHKWGSLVKAGFERVDAALVVPGTTNQAYFFRGREFCRVSLKENAKECDALLEGPHLIRERWSNLGFDTIDTIIPSPTSKNHAYVFSGKQAARIILVPGGGVDVDRGPYVAAAHWQSLQQAGFL